jgi:hypothetical protein
VGVGARHPPDERSLEILRRAVSIRGAAFVKGAGGGRWGHHPHDESELTMPQYLMSVWHDDDYDTDFTDPAVQEQMAETGRFNEELQAAGAWVFANGLHSTSSATVVRAVDGDVSMTDGPYAETKEQMGGFWVIEVDDLDTALAWAAKATVACEAPVEVRPFHGE